MRTCLSFLTVEYMRQGIPVGLACSKAIERLKQLTPLHKFEGCNPALGTGSGGVTVGSPTDGGNAPALVVGIVAMDKYGTVSIHTNLALNLLKLLLSLVLRRWEGLQRSMQATCPVVSLTSQ